MSLVERYIITDGVNTPGGTGVDDTNSGASRAYASVSEWEANEQTDLVSDTDTHLAHWRGTTEDTIATDINGWTTDATYYPTLQVDAANRPTSLQYSTSHPRLHTTASAIALMSTDDHTRIFGLQIWRDNTTADVPCVEIGSDSFQIAYFLIRGNNNSSWYDTGINITNAMEGTSYVWNNVIYNIGGSFARGIRINPFSGSDVIYVYSNTVQGCATGGIERLDGVVYAKNNIVQDMASGDCYSGTFHGDSTNNCSDDGTQPGGSGQNGEVLFINEGADDFGLQSGDTVAKSNGTNTSGESAPLDFDDDFLGTTRGATWDIGAHQVTVVGGVTGKSNPLMGVLGGPLYGPLG